jgi:hypothetical protein
MTEKGRESIVVFGLNDGFPRQLPRERKGVLLGLTVLLQAYDETVESNPQKALEIKERIFDYPFGAVLDWMVATAQTPNAARLLDSVIAALIDRHRVC